MKYQYAAIFTEEIGGGYTVQCYDVPGALSCGETIAEAVYMITDALGGMLMGIEDDHEPIPTPTPVADIPLESNQLVRIIEIDMDEHRAKMQRFHENPVKYAREKEGMTVQELADYLGAPYRTLKDWDDGKHLPPKWIGIIIHDHIVVPK